MWIQLTIYQNIRVLIAPLISSIVLVKYYGKGTTDMLGTSNSFVWKVLWWEDHRHLWTNFSVQCFIDHWLSVWPFFSVIVLSVFLLLTASAYPFGIFKFVLWRRNYGHVIGERTLVFVRCYGNGVTDTLSNKKILSCMTYRIMIFLLS